MSVDPGFHALWATPLAVYRFADADTLNPVIARMLSVLRIAQCTARGERTDAPFFASDDDLLQRLRTPEGETLVRFVVGSLQDAVGRANAGHWPPGLNSMKVAIEGMWFQCSSAGAFHDVHTHGNCSWSGVYVVQVDPPERRRAHPLHGAQHGVTRFYGPRFSRLGGAHVDLGNAYLQPPHVDVDPVPGQLTLFPSWLPHQAMPYDGDSERIVVSFNASVHATDGTDRLHRFSAG